MVRKLNAIATDDVKIVVSIGTEAVGDNFIYDLI